MKPLINYLLIDNDAINLFEADEIKNVTSLYEAYTLYYDKLSSIKEGLFSKLGAALKKMGDKAAEKGQNIDDTINKLSNDAKQAIQDVKNKAKDSWDSIKDVYVNTIAKVDDAIAKSKASVEGIAKQTGMKVSEVQGKIATILTNAIAKGNTKLSNMFSDTKKMIAINAFLSGAMGCIKAGMNTDNLLDIMTAAGIN